ncbi:MAG: hypothetical protein QNJ55_19085 [Xenococcus sp. MO_188.B8]|nr:hypothetical protein [Xenococcus sp. MO_188.B8]
MNQLLFLQKITEIKFDISVLAAILTFGIAIIYLALLEKKEKHLISHNEKNKSETDFWSPKHNKLGVFHGDEEKKISIIIFVHGLFGDCASTFGNLPFLIDQEISPEADYFSYSYQSLWWQRSEIRRAARILRQDLKDKDQYRHIIFITHSTGGLIVKELMNLEYNSFAEQKLNKGNLHTLYSNEYLPYRTRKILNISVPHNGGKLYLTLITSSIYALIFPLMLLLGIVSSLSTGKVGVNWLIWQLTYNNLWLKKLNKKYKEFIELMEQNGQLVPYVKEYCSSEDAAVNCAKENRIDIPGTHHGGKWPKSSKDLIVRELSKEISIFKKENLNRIAITESTISKINLFESDYNIDKLFRKKNEENDNSRIVRYAQNLSQESIFNKILSTIKDKKRNGERVIVTGKKKVGKSSILRRVARYLASDYLPNQQKVLPIVILLGDIKLDDIKPDIEEFEAKCWKKIQEIWLESEVNTYLENVSGQKRTIGLNWILEEIKNSDTILILDGLDEFMFNHPYYEIDDFIRILKHAEILAEEKNLYHKSIIGVRSTQIGIRALSNNSYNFYEVSTIDRSDVNNIFPNASKLINKFRGQGIEEEMCNPMILFYLENTDLEAVPQLDTVSGLHDYIISTIYDSITEQIKKNFKEKGGNLEKFQDCLSIIAWLMYCNYRGEISEEEVVEKVDKFLLDWNDVPTFAKENEWKKIKSTALMLKDRDVLRFLLRRSVIFYSYYDSTPRLSHFTWGDYLVSRYMAICVKAKNYLALRDRNLNAINAEMAGEQVLQGIITAAEARYVVSISQSNRDDGPTMLGCFASLLCNLRSKIEPDILTEIYNSFDEFPIDIHRHLFSAGLGFRLLRKSDTDQGFDKLRDYLPNQLIKIVINHQRKPGYLLLAFNSYCTLKALQNKKILKARDCDAISRYQLNPDIEMLERDGLRLTTNYRNQPYYDRFVKEIQEGLFTIVSLVSSSSKYSDLIIVATHYAYGLACAYKHQKLRKDLIPDLLDLCSEKSKFSEVISSYSSSKNIPELLLIRKQTLSKLEYKY